MDNIPGTTIKDSTSERAVVCIIGTLRSLDITHKNLIQKVIKPLNADLIFCITRLSEEDESLLDYFKDFNIIDVCIYEDGKRGYEDVCEEFSKEISSDNKDQWHKYFNIKGNWLGGMRGRKGSGMHLTYNFWKLLERLQYLEAKGFDYQRLIITRTDLLWMAEHPPLKLLDPKFIWIPTGEDHAGYNDRHAVCSKRNVSQYLNLFEFMMNLKALKFLNCNLTHGVEYDLNHEGHLKRHLDYCGIGVGRFKSVAYLTGSQNSLTNWGSVKKDFIDGKEYAYKYKEELLHSLRNSKEFESHKDFNRMVFRVPLFRERFRLLKERVKYKYPGFLRALKKFKDKIFPFVS